MKIPKKIVILALLMLGTNLIINAQDAKTTLEFENAEIVEKVIRNYTEAL